MKVFFDNCTSPTLAATLDGYLFHSGHGAAHIRDLPCGRNASDIKWIAFLRDTGGDWLVVTGDQRIHRNKAERAAFRQAGLKGVVLASAYQKTPINQQIATLAPPFLIEIRSAGRAGCACCRSERGPVERQRGPAANERARPLTPQPCRVMEAFSPEEASSAGQRLGMLIASRCVTVCVRRSTVPRQVRRWTAAAFAAKLTRPRETAMFREAGRSGGGGRAARNVLGEPLEPCSRAPLTGFYRDGCCNTGPEDRGSHTICALVTDDFLAFSKARGNDLSTPMPAYGFPGLKAGDRWCLCAPRWQEAFLAGTAPRVVLKATHEGALAHCALADLKAHAADLS